ncbi:MAG: pyridoxal phosphate-dependent aminotransferase [Bacteroidetes bacterium]|jgi:aspartate aminotransferase|nr:pyridoxal phosphate-dependent aminotransferase [Bacteroidota bacterium]MBK7039320.1 pyridoxal phosphate-dependent aminotransferase [Bacteroidota bacterium]MBK7588208.1 pyridoxal phosphate-dependent aminotransferase [Bacteroidota bacterium]MBK8329039.1 pyridoxal phosphate-dependent aminotransferase [Bacteroidota bacterium]HQW46363.1 pyridoxal phosphate-dependent aminotransferase [Chitinophagaceae bacterium]
MKLANRLLKIDEPQTIRMAKLSRELKSQGKDIIDLSLGEPDFKTPDHIIEAAIKAMHEGYTKYPPVAGFPELRQAIVDKFKNDNHLSYATDEVMVSTGAKQCIANAVLSVVNEGDEVLIPAPFWVTYSDIVKLADGVVVQLFGGFENDFKITATQLESAITSKTKLFIFSSPCNPTGSIYSKEELSAMADVFAKHPNIFIISDEIYEYINFEGNHESIAQFDAIKDRVIVINGLSKAYAMTGWRLGYMAANKEIIKACEKIQSQITSGANSITQRAAIAALNGDKAPTQMMRQAFKERRDFLVHALRDIKGLKVNNPPGAFYVFPDVSYYIGKKDIHTAEDLCMYLLDAAQVSCVTGDAFGNPHCIRISYATSIDKLQEAVKRIKIALEALDA